MRWLILSLLFVATTINYLDRAILGVLLPEINRQFNIGPHAYGYITFWFQIAYAAGSLVCGRLLDKYGARIGYGLAAVIWSASATLNAFAASALQFGLLRTILGLGESANFPACTKAAAEFFPASQRAIAMGVVVFGTNLANIIGPPLFIWITLKLNWQTCFMIIGGLGFLWVPAWYFAYRPSRQEVSKLSIKAVLRYKQAWGYAWAKFLTDPVWWFYLFWIPTYLNDVRHFTAQERAVALTIIYAISGVGAMAGGAISSFLIRHKWQVGKSRKTAMLICAFLMPVSGFGVVVENGSFAVLLFSLGMAAHQAWMTNLFTTPADVFPNQAVGSVNGFGVCLGALGGALFSGLIPGYVLPILGYVPVLLTMSCFYLIAWLLVHKLMGSMRMIALGEDEPQPAPLL